jgi:hypothetical protein
MPGKEPPADTKVDPNKRKRQEVPKPAPPHGAARHRGQNTAGHNKPPPAPVSPTHAQWHEDKDRRPSGYDPYGWGEGYGTPEEQEEDEDHPMDDDGCGETPYDVDEDHNSDCTQVQQRSCQPLALLHASAGSWPCVAS